MSLAERRAILRNLTQLGRMLRQAGVAVSPDQIADLMAALDLVDLSRREQAFYAARAVLVKRHSDLAVFELIFDRFLRGLAGEPEPGRARQRRMPASRAEVRHLERAGLLAAKPAQRPEEVDLVDRGGTYSPEELIRQRDFAEMSEEELDAVRRLLRETDWRLARRRTRRWRPDARGPRLNLRRMLRAASRHQGIALRLEYSRRQLKARPLVLLADISGSMERYSRLLLQFFYGAVQSLSDVECFVFATRLTRITGDLQIRNVDRALDAAARRIIDWSGGTRIGECLRDFNRDWSRRVLRRGAVAIIVSDGWERGDAEVLRREMRYLAHRCHRVIWLNPHLGHPGYEPLVEGMAAALPFLDDFMPVHNLDSLESLRSHLARLPGRASRQTGHGGVLP